MTKLFRIKLHYNILYRIFIIIKLECIFSERNSLARRMMNLEIMLYYFMIKQLFCKT